MIKIVAAATIIPAAFIFTAGVLHTTTPMRPDVLIVAPTSYDVNEDDPNWSCATMGNRVCAPTNVEGVNAGCYDDDAEIVAPWPCHTYVDEDGERNVVYDAATFDNGAMYKIMFR